MLKLGLRDSAANLFDRYQVSGKAGHSIRQATYLELLTPLHISRWRRNGSTMKFSIAVANHNQLGN